MSGILSADRGLCGDHCGLCLDLGCIRSAFGRMRSADAIRQEASRIFSRMAEIWKPGCGSGWNYLLLRDLQPCDLWNEIFRKKEWIMW